MTTYHIDTINNTDDIEEEEIQIGDTAIMDGKKFVCRGIYDIGEGVKYIWQAMDSSTQENKRAANLHRAAKNKRKQAKQSRKRNR